MKFLKLNKFAGTVGSFVPVDINPSTIQFIEPNKFQTDDGFGTFISFDGRNDDSEKYINVKESYQEVLHLLETFDDIIYEEIRSENTPIKDILTVKITFDDIEKGVREYCDRVISDLSQPKEFLMGEAKVTLSTGEVRTGNSIYPAIGLTNDPTLDSKLGEILDVPDQIPEVVIKFTSAASVVQFQEALLKAQKFFANAHP